MIYFILSRAILTGIIESRMKTETLHYLPKFGVFNPITSSFILSTLLFISSCNIDEVKPKPILDPDQESPTYVSERDSTLKDTYMVFIPGGNFQMGSNAGEANEQPVHNITLSDFYISKYEITTAQYIIFLNEAGVAPDGSFDDQDFGLVEYIDMDGLDCPIRHNGTKF